jgi:hypothetical protein
MKKGLIVLIVIVIVATGYWRESIFININRSLQFSSLSPDGMEWHIEQKYLLTGMFAVIYLVECLLMLWVIFKDRYTLNIALYVYAGLIILSGGIFLMGSYPVSRELMGLVQSPILIMLLVGASYLRTRHAQSRS